MKAKHKKKKQEKTCFDCICCVYAGGGDHICDEHNKLLTEDWVPADDFYYCGGKDFREM